MTPTLERAEKRIKELEDQLKQAKALKQKVEARARAEAGKKKRAEDTRRKVLVGSMMLDHMEKNEAIKTSVMGELDAFLTKDGDRALFGMNPKEKS